MEKALKLADYVGLNPQKTDKLSLLKSVTSLALIVFILLSASVEFLLNLDKSEVIERSTESFVSPVEAMLRIFFFAIYKKELNVLITNLKCFWKTDHFAVLHEKRFKQTERKIDIFFYIYTSLTYISCVVYILISYFLMPRKTMLLCYGTLDSDFKPFYFTVNYILQILTIFVSSTVVIAYDTMFFYFAWYIFTEFSLIKIAFQKWNNQKTWDKQEFTEAVRHHDFILNYVKELINQVFSSLFFFQYFINVFTICFCLFMITRHG